MAVTPGMLDVPGARLYYAVRGRGQVLLILPGGDGDADASEALADQLAAHYTVVTYDRRGQSRSPIGDSGSPVDLAVHAEDAARLLAALSEEPALVFGTSLGAVLGLELLVRHPGRVRRLVAHEAPVTDLLPAGERESAARAQEEIEAIHRRDGVAAAMRQFLLLGGVDLTDREPDLQIPAPRPERMANLEFFLTHDAPAVRLYRLDRTALTALADRVVPAVGENSTGTLANRCTQALAGMLGSPARTLPGGHSGAVLRPRAFAARLHDLLNETPAGPSGAAAGGDSPAG